MVSRQLHALILGLAGGALAKLAITGDSARYVRAGLRPYLIAGAIVLVGVAVASLWPRAAAQPDGDDGHGHTHAHGHGHGRFDVAWLLVIPMVTAVLLAPPALSSFSASRSGTALSAAAGSAIPPLPAGDPVRVSVLDYASRAVYGHGTSLTGRHLTLSGFLVSGGPNGWYLTRMVITCCAADAQPIKVGLDGTVPAGLRAGAWIEVTGSYTSRIVKDTVNGEAIPFLHAATVKPIPAPDQQYVS
jgi:putative membrane protein